MTNSKIILFGEHSVIYNKKAIGLPIFSLFIKASFVSEDIFEDPQVKFIKKTIEEIYDISNNMNIKIESNIPIASGLGSSTALAIEISRAYISKFKKEIDIEKIVLLAENNLGLNPSGLDTKLILSKKALIFQKNKESITLDFKLNKALLIFDSGISSSTSYAVNHVFENLDRFSKYIDNLGDIANESITYFKNSDYLNIGLLMNTAQENLKAMELSNDKIDHLINSIKDLCYGVKMSGSCLGGIIIALIDKEKYFKISNILNIEGIKNIWLEDI